MGVMKCRTLRFIIDFLVKWFNDEHCERVVIVITNHSRTRKNSENKTENSTEHMQECN